MTDKNKDLDVTSSYTFDSSWITTCTIDCSNTASAFVFTDNAITTVFEDPYTKLEEYELERENDEALRNKHPVLQEVYDDYQLIRKLFENNEIDKSFEKRYEDFEVK